MKEITTGREVINFRGLIHNPVSPEGVIFLFGMVAPDLDIYIEEARAEFPRFAGKRYTGEGWEAVSIEAELNSSDFKKQGYDPDKCDILVCWEHDWPDCPLEVIELKEKIKSLPNPATEAPDAHNEDVLNALYEGMKVNDNIRKLFRSVDRQVREINDKIWAKATDTGVIYYSPERPFLYAFPKPKIINFQLFSGDQTIEGIRYYNKDSVSSQWGYVNLDYSSIQTTLNAIKISYQLMRQAIKNHEPIEDFNPKIEDNKVESNPPDDK